MYYIRSIYIKKNFEGSKLHWEMHQEHERYGRNPELKTKTSSHAADVKWEVKFIQVTFASSNEIHYKFIEEKNEKLYIE